MTEFQKKPASEFGIQPAYVGSKEKHGLCFFTWHDSVAVGAQCSHCNTIVWLDPRFDVVLNERKPVKIPASGEDYRSYYEDKINRFLKSLPDCPSCGHNLYNRFVNNTSYPRYADGTDFDDNNGGISLRNEDPGSVQIWWLEPA